MGIFIRSSWIYSSRESIRKLKLKKKNSLTRKEFLKISSLATAGGILLPKFLISQDCELTTDDILGPFYDENAPFRTG